MAFSAMGLSFILSLIFVFTGKTYQQDDGMYDYDYGNNCAGVENNFCPIVRADECYVNVEYCPCSCGKLATNITDCMYGDRATVCREEFCSNEANWFVCCGTCQEYIASARTANPTSSSVPTVSSTETLTLSMLLTTADSLETEVSSLSTQSQGSVRTGSTAHTIQSFYSTSDTISLPATEVTTQSSTNLQDLTTTSSVQTTTINEFVSDEVTTFSEVAVSQSEAKTTLTHTTPSSSSAALLTTGSNLAPNETTKPTKSTDTTPTITSTTTTGVTTSSRDTFTQTSVRTTDPTENTSLLTFTDSSQTNCTDSGVDRVSCNDFINRYGIHQCYFYYDECCETCSELADEDNLGCEYGDRESWCQDIETNKCYFNEQRCCSTCPKVKTDIKGCEYGNRLGAFCTSINKNECSDVEDLCCETCRQLNNEDIDDITRPITSHGVAAFNFIFLVKLYIPTVLCDVFLQNTAP